MPRIPVVALVALTLLSPIAGRAGAESLVLKADRMLDVVAGRIVDGATVVVSDGVISAVNPATTPQDARVVELGDRTLLPGLIDSHVHLAIPDASFGSRLVSTSGADAALIAAQSARKTLEAGFTTVRDLGQTTASLDLVVVALAHAIGAGRVPGPEVVASGHALSITGGHIDPAMFMSAAEGLLDLGPDYGIADGPDEVLHAVRYQIKHGARVIKIAATAGAMSLEGSVGAQQYSEEEMRVAVEEAARHGLAVAAHAHGTEGIKAAVRAGVASIEHGSLLDDEAIAMMKERGTFLVPTTALADSIPLDGLPSAIVAKARYVVPLAKASVSRAIEAGVKIAMGSDAPLIPHGENAREIVAMADRGMSPIEAIRAATVHAAELMDLPDRGRIAEGLRADLVAVPGNPLEELAVLQRVDFVVQAGRIVRQGDGVD